jgi:hypothetical protein
MSKKMMAIIGTATLAIGLMAIPAFASQGQAYGWGQMQNYMYNNQSTSAPNVTTGGVNSPYGYGMTNGYGGYGMMSGYAGSNGYGGYGMMGGM